LHLIVVNASIDFEISNPVTLHPRKRSYRIKGDRIQMPRLEGIPEDIQNQKSSIHLISIVDAYL